MWISISLGTQKSMPLNIDWCVLRCALISSRAQEQCLHRTKAFSPAHLIQESEAVLLMLKPSEAVAAVCFMKLRRHLKLDRYSNPGKILRQGVVVLAELRKRCSIVFRGPMQKMPLIQKQRIQHEQETPLRYLREFSLRSLSAQGCALIFGRIRRRLGVSMFVLKLSVGFQRRSLSPEGLLHSFAIPTCSDLRRLEAAGIGLADALALHAPQHLNIPFLFFFPTDQVRLF